MPKDESVTVWLRQLGKGNQGAAKHLWERYSQTLERLARLRFSQSLNEVFSEEDLVQSVFITLWKGAGEGRWDDVANRNELWWLLLRITRCKALKRTQYNSRQKRAAPQTTSLHDSGPVDDTPPPELILMLDEQREQLMAKLPSDVLRSIATWKLEGFSNLEIAAKLDVSPRTVIRKLDLIRQAWNAELET